MDVIQKLAKIWDDDYLTEFSSRQQYFRAYNKGGNVLKALFDIERSKYYMQRVQGIKEEDGSECIFDTSSIDQDKLVKGETLYYMINKFPYFDKHFLAFPQEHRQFPRKKDLDELIACFQDTNHAIFMNASGSGAGIPQHIHYHGVNASLPISNENYDLIANDKHYSLATVSHPAFALRMSWFTDEGRDEVSLQVADYLNDPDFKPGNILIQNNRLFLIPRSAEYSMLVPEWKIASAEVCGLFIIRSEKHLSLLSYDFLDNILKTTTLINENEIEKSIKYFKQRYDMFDSP